MHDDHRYLIETQRLKLRPYTMDDLDDIAAILGDPETMQFYPHAFSREESRRWIARTMERYSEDGFGLWVIVSKQTHELLGNCGPVVQNVDAMREVELGWHVARPHWRRGIATEAARACRDHAFKHLGLTRLISLIRPKNVPSRKVAERIGMTIEKETHHADYRHYVYSMSGPAPR